jgi:outer membrane protein assembly factor BamB
MCPAQENWPQFRGPNGCASYRSKGAETVPVEWGDNDYNWKVKLPGTGHSSPVIWGDKLFITCSDKSAKRTICCLSTKDGKTLWQKDYKGKKHKMNRDNSFASSSPAADADRVYICWGDPDEVAVVALTHEGKEVWRRNLGPFSSSHGYGTSPFLHDGMVILNNIQLQASSLVALDAATGKDKWKTRQQQQKVSYVTPPIYKAEGDKAQLIFCSTARGVMGVDPATGRVLWSAGGPIDETIRPVCAPVLAGNLIVATWGKGGRGISGFAVRAGTTDGKTKPEIAYKFSDPMHYTCTPVVMDRLMFACTDRGEMQCFEVATGKKLWAVKEKGGFYSSPVLVGGRVYFITKTGNMVVVAATEKFKRLASMNLGEKSFATPALANGVMYIRTFSRVMSIGGKK